MYKYYNNNPDNEKLSDCVIRAMTLALDIDYYDIVSLLYENGEKYKCHPLSVDCYGKLLDEYFGLKHYTGYGKTIGEISKEFKDNILLVRTNGHLTTSMYGNICDIWDCSDKIATDFWIIN